MAAALIEQLTQVACSPVAGWLLGDGHVRVEFTQRDPRAGKIRRMVREMLIVGTPPDSQIVHVAFPVELGAEVLASAVSPSGSKMARFTESADAKGKTPSVEKSRYLEIWVRDRLAKTIQLAKRHSDIYIDEVFGGFSWSPDETKLVYVAEANKQEGRGFWDPQETLRDESSPELYDKHLHKYDFGESYTGRRNPCLFIADLTEGSVSLVGKEQIPATLAVANPQWSPDGKKLLFCGTFASDPPLGIRYCWNRPFLICLYNIQSKEFEIITEQNSPVDYCARSPRFTPSGDGFVYLAAPQTSDNVHMSTQRLRSYNFVSKETRTLVDLVDQSLVGDIWTDFPGVYQFGGLSKNPFVDSGSLVLETCWGFNMTPVLVCLDGSSPPIRLFSSDDDVLSSFTVLDVRKGHVLCSQSKPTQPPSVVLAQISAETRCLSSTVKISDCATEFADELGVHGPVDLILNEKDDFLVADDLGANQIRSNRFQALLVAPKNTSEGSPPPLLCFPHGGPHSAHLTAFSVGITALVKWGYAVVLVNYRGSIGLGQDSLLALPGHVGDLDVRECVAATRWAMNITGSTSAGVIGGSHGGFLGGHLSGQYPEIYKVAILRNPVCNIATMVGGSDIPDWCYCEAGFGSEDSTTSSRLQKMFESSPMAYVNGVRAATLLQIGTNDRRVPPQQGLEWSRALARNKVPVRVMMYEGSEHGLADALAGDDSWAQALLWLEKYLPLS